MLLNESLIYVLKRKPKTDGVIFKAKTTWSVGFKACILVNGSLKKIIYPILCYTSLFLSICQHNDIKHFAKTCYYPLYLLGCSLGCSRNSVDIRL